MFATVPFISLMLLIIETLIGVVGNGLIVTTLCKDWVKKRRLSSADMLVSCLSLSRLASEILLLANTAMFYFSSDLLKTRVQQSRYFLLWMFTKTLCIWFASWLSILYCVKIANFSHFLFLQMKLRFSRLVPRLIGGTVFLSAGIATIVVTNRNFFYCDLEKSLSVNGNDSKIETPSICLNMIFLYVVPDIIPFIMFLFSSSLLLISLWKHLKRLWNRVTDLRDLNTEVHLNAIKALASFAILYVASFAAETLGIVLFLQMKDRLWLDFIINNVIAAYFSLHAIILISINPRLKEASLRMLHQLKCHSREAPS